MTSTTTLMYVTRAVGRPHRSMVGAPVDSSALCLSDGAGNGVKNVFANPDHAHRVAVFINTLLDADRAESEAHRAEYERQAAGLEEAAQRDLAARIEADPARNAEVLQRFAETSVAEEEARRRVPSEAAE